MKKAVSDDLVNEYAKRLRAGGPLGEVFSFPLSECEFTEAQKLRIKEARKARAKLHKALNPQSIAPAQEPKISVTTKPTAPALGKPTTPVATKTVAPVPTKSAAPAPPSVNKAQPPKKLERMLYLQQNKCFFCGEKLALADASIEHLHPLSRGGARTEDNEVVCHKSLNAIFGNLGLKWKFEFVLKASGAFQCPGK